MTTAAWLLVTVTSWGSVDIEGPLKADICEERIVEMERVSLEAWGKSYGAQCVHNQQPWRRILPTGPNQQERRAREMQTPH